MSTAAELQAKKAEIDKQLALAESATATENWRQARRDHAPPAKPG